MDINIDLYNGHSAYPNLERFICLNCLLVEIQTPFVSLALGVSENLLDKYNKVWFLDVLEIINVLISCNWARARSTFFQSVH